MRVKFTVTVDYETAENLRQLSKVTRINISRLMDEAVEDLTDKYNLDELVNTGNFSSELYYQLNAVVINVLPLRQRKEDIIPIANYYLNSFNQKSGYAFTDFTESAKEEMENYFWTGNADELINSIQRGFIVGKVPLINSEDLGIGIAAASDTETKTLKEALDAFKKDYVTKVLQENGWNQTKTAKILGIQRTYVIRLINELQIRK